MENTVKNRRKIVLSINVYNIDAQNEDTEWNDILRAKGIIPEKPKEAEITEDDIVSMLEQTVKEKVSGKI